MNKKYIYLALGVIFVVMQFFGIDKTNPPIDEAKTFIAMENPDAETLQLMKTACYDCHSHQTEYPWYTSLAPLSWWINGHIEHGREHLNLSAWGDYTDKQRSHKIEEVIEVVDGKEMPMLTYWLVHWEAKLTPEQRTQITDFMRKIE